MGLTRLIKDESSRTDEITYMYRIQNEEIQLKTLGSY